MEQNTMLKIANLNKLYGNKLVLNSVSLEIGQGEIFGIVGPSGAGKTTLLECIVGFTGFQQGEVLVSQAGSLVSARRHKDIKKKFGFAAQCPSFYGSLTVRENLEYFGSLYGLDRNTLKHNAEVLINLVGLSGDGNTLARNLSGGMQKRLDVACALIHGPRILILDEPTADLDPMARKQMAELIKKINAEGTTIIIASHIFDEIEKICSRISVINRHNISAVGSVDSLKKQFNARNLDQVFEAAVK